MMGGDEVRRLAREKIIKQLFGENFRHDDPVNTLGGAIGEIVECYGIPDYAIYRERTGAIKGLKHALQHLTDSYREANEPPNPMKEVL